MLSIPVACILAHSINRNDEVVPSLMKWIETYWDAYASGMRTGGKDDVLEEGYQNGMGWLGWKLYAMSIMEWFIPFMPVEEADSNALKESLGVCGIHLMRVGFGDEKDTVEQLQSTLVATIQTEISRVAAKRDGMLRRRRRSSILREKNRRVSDAFIHLSLSTRHSLSKIVEDLE